MKVILMIGDEVLSVNEESQKYNVAIVKWGRSASCSNSQCEDMIDRNFAHNSLPDGQTCLTEWFGYHTLRQGRI